MKTTISLPFLATLLFLAACGPSATEISTGENTPAAESSTDLTGTWEGTLTETVGETRTFSLLMQIVHDPLSGTVGGIMVTESPYEGDGSNYFEGIASNGLLQAIVDSGEYLSLTAGGGSLEGTLAYECYECDIWGEISLSYVSSDTSLFTGEQGSDEGTQPTSQEQNSSIPTGLIAFASNAIGDYEIYTVRPDLNEFTQLTSRPETNDSFPQWSPDGQTIAFYSSHTSGLGDTTVDLMNSDGSDLRSIMLGGGAPFWSPNGQRIAVVNYLGLFSIAPDGSNLVQLVDNVGEGIEFLLAASWSPTSDHIAVAARMNSGTDAIFISDISGETSPEMVWESNNEAEISLQWVEQNTLAFLLGDQVRNVRLIEFDLGTRSLSPLTQEGELHNFLWLPNSTFVILHEGVNVSLLDTQSLITSPLTSWLHPEMYDPNTNYGYDLSISSDGQWLVAKMDLPIVVNIFTLETLYLDMFPGSVGFTWQP